MRSYTARWVLPLDRPPLAGGVLTVSDDRVISIESYRSRPADDLGDVALLPGFVNAHTHLDLTGMAGLAPPSADFTSWLQRVIGHRRTRSTEQIHADIAAGIAQSLRFGTTLVGDISADGASWDPLAASPLRAFVFREILGLTTERAKAARATLDAWIDKRPVGRCRPGISPHAPYSVHVELYRAASACGLPVCTHVAESRDELELLADHRGAFVDFLKGVGGWNPEGLASSVAHVVGLLAGRSAPVLLAHANYLPLDIQLGANVTVVYCPRTHAAFGHPAHPFLDFQARGVRVVLGTDSLASNPDLDILAEVRFLHQTRPEVPPETLLRMATDSESLGVPRDRADMVAVPVRDGDPYEAVIHSVGPRRVMIGGKWLSDSPPQGINVRA